MIYFHAAYKEGNPMGLSAEHQDSIIIHCQNMRRAK